MATELIVPGSLVSPHDTVARVLHMTEVDRLVPVYGSVAEAASV